MARKGLGTRPGRALCVAATLLLSCQRRQRHLSCVLLPRAGNWSLQLLFPSTLRPPLSAIRLSPFAICHSFCSLCRCTSLMQISICVENKYASSNSAWQHNCHPARPTQALLSLKPNVARQIEYDRSSGRFICMRHFIGKVQDKQKIAANC